MQSITNYMKGFSSNQILIEMKCIPMFSITNVLFYNKYYSSITCVPLHLLPQLEGGSTGKAALIVKEGVTVG